MIYRLHKSEDKYWYLSYIEIDLFEIVTSLGISYIRNISYYSHFNLEFLLSYLS